MACMCVAVCVQNPNIASAEHMGNSIEADDGADDRTGLWSVEPAQTSPKDNETARNNELTDALGSAASVAVRKVCEIRIEMT